MKKYEEIKDIKRLIIYLPFLQEGLEYAKKNNINEVYITTQIETDTSFLNKKSILDVNLITHYDFIESIILTDLWGVFKDNICLNELSKLSNLKKIEIKVDNIFIIDLSLFKKLTHISYYDSKLISGLCKLNNLESVTIYNLDSKDLGEFSNSKNLNSLTLWDCKNQTLDGLSELEHLVELEIVRSKKLIDVSGLKKSKNLTKIEMQQCSKLENISIISNLKKLEKLTLKKNKLITNLNQIIPNNIFFLRIDKIDNLDFILKMNRLKRIAFDCVTSNDLTPLFHSLSLESASFVNKKSYNYTQKDIESFFNNNKTTT